MRTTIIATPAILWFGVITAVTPLHVANAQVTCHGGSANFMFNPGVQFKKQTVQIQGSGDLGVCSSAKAPKITGGVFRFVGSGTGNCPGPFAVGFGKVQISWNDGTQSIIPQASFRAEAFTASFDGGSVREGTFKGGNLRMSGRSTTSVIDMGTQCVTSGLTIYEMGIDSLAIGSI